MAGEQSERLRGAVPWLEDADIPSDWDQANRFRMRTTKAIHDHDMQPRTRLVAELERRLEQAERAESERPSPEQVKALALRMAEQRAQAENPTQDTKRPAPSGDEPLDLSEPEDWGEASPFESRQAPRTKADLLNDLTSQFTRFELAEFADLKSKYAKEFYRRAKQYRSSGIWKISRDEFCRLLSVPKSTAEQVRDLNKRVLKPIIEECGPLLGLKIERQYVKRRLSGFVFTFARETVAS